MISVKINTEYSLVATINKKSLSVISIANFVKMSNFAYVQIVISLLTEIHKMMNMTELEKLDKAVLFGFLKSKLKDWTII